MLCTFFAASQHIIDFNTLETERDVYLNFHDHGPLESLGAFKIQAVMPHSVALGISKSSALKSLPESSGGFWWLMPNWLLNC